MKLLADENFLGLAVTALREVGFDVVWVLEDLPGATDEEVLNQSVVQGRTLLTFDYDLMVVVPDDGPPDRRRLAYERLWPMFSYGPARASTAACASSHPCPRRS